MKLKAMVIGLGNIGLAYDMRLPGSMILTHSRAYQSHRGIDLVCGIDIDPAKRKRFTRVTARPAYPTIKEYARRCGEKIDLVSLCTPENVRLGLIKEIAALNPRAVIIEKPLAATPKEALQIKKILSARGIRACVNYMRRSDPLFISLRRLIDSGRLGRPLHACVKYSGGLNRNATHFINLIINYFGMPVNIEVLKRSKGRGSDYEAAFRMGYGNFSVSFDPLPERHYSLAMMQFFFTKAMIAISEDGKGAEVSAYLAKKDPVFGGYKTLRKASLGLAKPLFLKAQKNVVRNLLASLAGEERLDSGLDDAIKTLEVCAEVIHGA